MTFDVILVSMFQFTRLLRGATKWLGAIEDFLSFNSRASCEARRILPERLQLPSCFNSRASCEARLMGPISSPSGKEFQFTRLLRGATLTDLPTSSER